ncbi:hypothetical protein PG990_003110 [Apiospora arundinis]
MDAITGQSIARCPQCNKPFDKLSSLKRHGYYCRTKTPGDKASRVQSCLACVSGKARCDRKRPECSRCLNKGIDCRYSAQGPRSNARDRTHRVPGSSSSPSPDKAESSYRKDTPTADTAVQDADNGDSVDIDYDFMAALDAAPGSLGAATFDWATPKDADVFGSFESPTNNAVTQTLALENSTYTYLSSAFQLSQPFPLPRAVSIPYVFSIPRSPSSNNRSIVRRPKIKTGAQRVASLIYHTLKSYTLMMTRDNSLPPFIHPQMASSDIGSESLQNCVSLMQILGSGLHGNRKLFWRNVRLECERLNQAPSQLGHLEIIAALQALSIYLIVRVGEGETEDNSVDGLLIMTTITMSLELNRIDFGRQSALSATTPESTWRHWMFVESGRRLCILNQIVNMVVVFEPAAMCDIRADGLILPTLPARKQLWEADTAAKWMMEIERDLGAQTDYGMAMNGDLIKVCETGDGGVRSRQKADWEEWFSGMDSFGGLVMLAASLIG